MSHGFKTNSFIQVFVTLLYIYNKHIDLRWLNHTNMVSCPMLFLSSITYPVSLYSMIHVMHYFLCLCIMQNTLTIVYLNAFKFELKPDLHPQLYLLNLFAFIVLMVSLLHLLKLFTY
jgi:hypothetical protein